MTTMTTMTMLSTDDDDVVSELNTTGYRTVGFVHGLCLIWFIFYKNHAT